MNVKQAKFNIGQIVLHSESGYRGVVVDIDPEFSHKVMDVKPGDEPIQFQADPWYHVLLEEQDMQAYIAEQQLQRDTLGEPINHAYVEDYFRDFKQDHYIVRKALN